MTTLELLTKLTAIITAVSLAKTGMLTPGWATAFGVFAFVGSFVRDQWIRSREQLRMQPSWSFWFIVTYVMVLTINTAIASITSSWFFDAWGCVACAGVVSGGFRLFLIVAECLTRLFCERVLGFDNHRLDQVQRYIKKHGWRACSLEYPPPFRGTVVDGEVVEDSRSISLDHRGRWGR